MQPECICTGHTGAVSSVSIPFDGHLCTGAHDGTFKTWKDSGETIGSFRAHKTPLGKTHQITSSATAAEGRLIATGSNMGRVCLWSMNGKKALRIMDVNHAAKVPIVSVACTVRQPIGNLLISEITNTTGKLTDGNTGMAPVGIILVSGSSDGTAKLWDVNRGSLLRTFPSTPLVRSVTLSPRGGTLVTGCASGTAKLWDVDTGRELGALRRDDSNGIMAVALSPDERNFLVACGNTATLLEVDPISVKQTFHGHTGLVNCVAFKPNDSRYFVTGSDDKTVKLWKVRSKEAIFTFFFHAGPVRSVAFSPSGAHVLTGSDDKTAALWDLSRLGGMVLDASLSPFFRLLDEVDKDASDWSLYDLNKELAETVSDIQELRLFYSILSSQFKLGEITKDIRDDHLKKVLEGARKGSFKFDQECKVYSMLVMILNKAIEDRVISENDKTRLAAEYLKCNVFVDYRFQSLVATVKRHSAQISSLANYVKEVDNRLKKVETKGQIKGAFSLMLVVIPVIGQIPFFSDALGALLEKIADFADCEHVYKVCKDHFGEIRDMTETFATLKANPDTNLNDLQLENQNLMPVAAIMKLSICCLSYSNSRPVESKSRLRTGQGVPAEAEPATVQALLKTLGLTHHQQAFDEHAIRDFCDLLDLTDNDLEKIGLKKIGERNRMRNWIAKRKRH
jgi:WD40 repeat protein